MTGPTGTEGASPAEPAGEIEADGLARGAAASWLGVAAIVLVGGGGAYAAFQEARAGEASFWLLAAGPVLVLAPVALWMARRDGVLGEWMKPRAGDFTLGFFVAAALFAGAYAVSKTLTRDGSPRAIWLARLYLQLGDPNVLRAHPTALFVAILLVAAAEEIVWRGWVTAMIADVLGSRFAWVAAAGLYALAYVPTMWSLAAPSGPNPLLPLAALGAGLVWGAVARKVGRLGPGIVAHALFDWCVVVMFRLWGESL